MHSETWDTSNTWNTVARLARRFNAHDDERGLDAAQQWTLQVLKIAEETGEASQAVIGVRGTNPARATATPGRTCTPRSPTSSSPAWSLSPACAPTTPRLTSASNSPPRQPSSFLLRARRRRHPMREIAMCGI